MNHNLTWLKKRIVKIGSKPTNGPELFDEGYHKAYDDIKKAVDLVDSKELTEENVWIYLSEHYRYDKEALFAKLQEHSYLTNHAVIQKPIVPKFVADFYDNFEDNTIDFIYKQFQNNKDPMIKKWYNSRTGRHANPRANAHEILAKMKLVDYTIEKDSSWIIKVDDKYVTGWANTRSYEPILVDISGEIWTFTNKLSAEIIAELINGQVIPKPD